MSINQYPSLRPLFGPDVVRTVYYYKGLGQIHFSAGRVLEIMYDPTEDGYR